MAKAAASVVPKSFAWPKGIRAAVSLAFDDARPSHIDQGVPLLDRHGVRATFYVVPSTVERRRDDWRRTAERGHEIGGHTLTHPCSGNFDFVDPQRSLESMTLAQMENELLESNRAIESLVGARPTTFAYPCGQKFVGRGTEVRSYVPLVARHYLVGRGWRDEYPNVPARCDLAQVAGTELDGVSADAVVPMLNEAARAGTWLILVGHDIAPTNGGQTTLTSTLDAICRHCADRANGLWLDTVAAIGGHLRETRGS